MKLSLRELEICKNRCGKDKLQGFEEVDDNTPDLDSISNEELEKDVRELLRNELMEASADSIVMSALGWHVMNLMEKPEQFIMIENNVSGLCERLYISNTYYLYLAENRKIEAKDSNDRFILEYLPDLKMVVGSFVSSIRIPQKDLNEISYEGAKTAISITGRSWNDNGEEDPGIDITADYAGDECMEYDVLDPHTGVSEKKKSHMSEMINFITKWLFERLSETMQRKEKRNA